MPPYSHDRYCDLLAAEIERLAAAVAGADLDLVVPTCPEWSVRDLVDHCGSTLLWGSELVRRNSQERLRGLGAVLDPPVGRSGDPDVVRERGAELLETLRGADPDRSMWAWGEDQHVRFWSRRMLHEMLVHRVDLSLTAGLPVDVHPAIAADCVDEFFANLHRAADFSPRVLEITGAGETIAVQCTDVADSWTITLIPGDFAISSGTPPAPDVWLTGTARDLMLLINRRVPLDDLAVEITGDSGVLDFWLERSALE